MARLYYQGHGSFRITLADGRVIYIDPYAGDGYDKPADIILVTHQHGDHNQVGLITQKPDCRVITNKEALAGRKHNVFELNGVDVEAVPAANKNHDPDVCVGYILTVDGKKVYFAGDTSQTPEMKIFPALELDWAFLPCDGIYNMDLDEAAKCAEIIGAKHNVPVHMMPGALFDRERAEKFRGPNRVIVAAGEEIEL